MTASNASAPTSEPEHHGSTSLPSIGDLLRISITLTRRYAADAYGFSAYLLFPIILTFGVQGISGTLGDIFVSAVNVLFILTACWVQATITVLVPMRFGHPKQEPDTRSIGMHATKILGTLAFTALLSGLLQFAGFFCFIVPGIILSVLFAFAPEEVILRGCGPLSALATSRAKVQPYFFPVLWRLLALAGTTFGAYLVLTSLILGIASFATGIDPVALANVTPAWLDALLTVLQIVFLPPLIIGHTMLYLSLEEPGEKQEAKEVV